jgi:hypothetical protein
VAREVGVGCAAAVGALVTVEVGGTRVGVAVEMGVAWVGATVGEGLACALGVGVAVGAANAEVGRPPSAATARAAKRIQTRINGL